MTNRHALGIEEVERKGLVHCQHPWLSGQVFSTEEGLASAMNQELYDCLLTEARRRGYTTYTDAGRQIGLDMAIDADRDQMTGLLEEIARHEQDSGRPMLTAVVILRGENMPSDGFFRIAAEFGRFDDGDRLRFWIDALNEVHGYWQAH